MHLQAILRHFKRVANRVLFHEESLVKLSSKEYGGVIHDRIALLYANDVIDTRVMENLPSELTVAGGDEDEL